MISSASSPPELSSAAILATISHELRTPLTALTGYGELLSDAILGPLTPLQRDTIERMRTVTHHLSAMVDGLLMFSNLEMGRETVRLREVDPAHILRDAAVVVEPIARKSHIPLAVSPGSSTPLWTDADKVRHILVNLADNAIKFTEQGTVTLRTVDTPTAVCFEVEDTGIGIAPEDVARIFEPFAQLDAGLTRRYGGTGLGLYVAQGLAALLGAQVTVRSTLGAGSTFTLVVPRERDGGK